MNERGSASKVLLVVVLGIIVGCAVLYALVACYGSSQQHGGPSAPSGYTVKYDVIGEAGCSSASLTYENAQGGTEQRDVKLPWSKYYTMERGSFAYISAQNNNDHGRITCRIYVDGVEWKKSTSSGAYVIASCSGSVGR